MRERLTGNVPVDSVQDDWTGDDGINVDIGLPQSCHGHSQSNHPPLPSYISQVHLWEGPVWSRVLGYRREVQSARPHLLLHPEVRFEVEIKLYFKIRTDHCAGY